MEFQPLTIEGWECWDLIQRCQGQIRFVDKHFIGFDLTAVVTVAKSLGYNEDVMIRLLEHAEAGVAEAFRSNDGHN